MVQDHEVRSSFSAGREFLTRGYYFTYDIGAASSPTILSEITDEAIKLLPRTEFETDLLRDMKGVSAQDRITPSANTQVRNGGVEELFFLQGELPIQSEDTDETSNNDEETPTIPCTVIGTTRFHSFEGNSILHTFSLSSDTEELPVTSLTKLKFLSFRPLKLRLGIETFRSKFSFLSIGAWPTVSERLLLEADQYSVKVRIYADSLPTRTSPVLTREDLFTKLSAIFERCYNFNLIQDLHQKIAALS